MNNIYFAFLLAFMSMIMSSCSSGGGQVFNFQIERDFDIPSTLNTIETHFFQLKNVPTFIDERLAQNGMVIEDVGEISPGDANISASFDNIDWSFVRTVEVYVISRVDPNKRSRVFYINEPDYNDRSKVGLFNTFSDASEILKEETIDVEVRLRVISFVPGNIDARLTMDFAVFNKM